MKSNEKNRFNVETVKAMVIVSKNISVIYLAPKSFAGNTELIEISKKDCFRARMQ